MWDQDGGMNIYHHFGLSEEPLMGRVARDYGLAPKLPATGDKIHDANLRQRAYQTEYMEYWNSTAFLTKTGRLVDAVLCPVTPFAALELGKTQSIGKSLPQSISVPLRSLTCPPSHFQLLPSG